jgi:hypothetical protein
VKDRSGLLVCSFVVNALQHQVTGNLEKVPAVAEHVRGNPDHPQRNSDHKDD